MYKKGGFPPIIYCQEKIQESTDKSGTKKERFFSNAPRKNINIRQLLSETNKKPLIVIEDNKEPDIEIVDTL